MNNKKKYFSLTVTALLMGYSFSSFGSEKLPEKYKNMCINGVVGARLDMPDITMSITMGYAGAINNSLATINELLAKENKEINFDYKIMNIITNNYNNIISSNKKNKAKLIEQKNNPIKRKKSDISFKSLYVNGKEMKPKTKEEEEEIAELEKYINKYILDKRSDIKSDIISIAMKIENSIRQIGPISPKKILKKIMASKQFPQNIKKEFPNLRLEKTKSGKFEVYLHEDESKKLSLYHNAEKNNTTK